MTGKGVFSAHCSAIAAPNGIALAGYPRSGRARGYRLSVAETLINTGFENPSLAHNRLTICATSLPQNRQRASQQQSSAQNLPLLRVEASRTGRVVDLTAFRLRTDSERSEEPSLELLRNCILKTRSGAFLARDKDEDFLTVTFDLGRVRGSYLPKRV